MDYEREPETELGDSSSEPGQPSTVGGDAATDETSSTLSSEQAPEAATEGVTDENTAYPAAPAKLTSEPAEESATFYDATPTAIPTTEAASHDETDLDSDADVLDDAFSTPLAPPDWPAADLVGGGAAAADEAERDIAAAYAASSDSSDLGDDSDAPVLTDAAADEVNLSQGGVQSINAKTVTFSQGGAGRVNADEMNVSQSGVGMARVGNLTLGEGASAFAVVADEATVEPGSNTFLVVARSFNGETRPTIDWRTAAAFGAGVGLVISIFRRIR